MTLTGLPICSKCGTPLALGADAQGLSGTVMVMGGDALNAMMERVVRHPRACQHCQKNYCTACAAKAGKMSGRTGSQLACPDCGRSLGNLGDPPSYIESYQRPASSRTAAPRYTPTPKVAAPKPAPILKTGEWICPICGGINSPKRDRCLGCNATKYDVPKPASAPIPAKPKVGLGWGAKLAISFMAGFVVTLILSQIYYAIWNPDPNAALPGFFVPSIYFSVIVVGFGTWKLLGKVGKNKGKRQKNPQQFGRVEKLQAKGDAAGLIKLLENNDDENMRGAAARALGGLKDASALTALSAGLKENSRSVRKSCIEALGELKDARAVEALVGALKDSGDVRIAAIRALGELQDERASAELVGILRDTDKEMRNAAVSALEKIGWQPGKDENGAAYWFAKGNLEECAACGEGSVELLIEALNSGGNMRQPAARALGGLKDARAIEPLAASLLDKDVEMRKTAAEALEKIGWQPEKNESGAAYWILQGKPEECVAIGATAVEALITALAEADLRPVAASALVSIGEPAIEPLIKALQDKDRRQFAAETLVKFGGQAIKPLLKRSVGVPDDRALYTRTWTLGQIGAPALQPLIAVINGEGLERTSVIGPSFIADQFKQINQENNQQKQCVAAGGLGWLGDATAIEPLRAARATADPVVREAIDNALKKLVGPLAGEKMPDKHELVFQEENVRKAVGDILQRPGITAGTQKICRDLLMRPRIGPVSLQETLDTIQQELESDPLVLTDLKVALEGCLSNKASAPVEKAPLPAQVKPLEWEYFEHRAQGLRLPHPKGWVISEANGKLLLHAPNPRLVGGGILELGMTLVCMDTSNSPLAQSGDMPMCKKFMETLVGNAGGSLDWSEEGQLSTGQTAVWFGYHFSKAGVNMKAVCALAHKDHSMTYLDVTGLADLIEARSGEWKKIVHALEVK